MYAVDEVQGEVPQEEPFEHVFDCTLLIWFNKLLKRVMQEYRGAFQTNRKCDDWDIGVPMNFW